MKTFGVSKAAAVRIHERLQQQVEQILHLSGLPIIKSTEATQRGDSFGCRLANAVSDCWTQGFDNLIIVGGDTPELTLSDIEKARKALAAGKPTLGKDFRGGSFLIGLLKGSFRQNQFAELPWQTKQIACALKAELGLTCESEQPEVFELGCRADCNTRRDLSNFAKRSSSTIWSALLHISDRNVREIESDLNLVSCFGESPALRGPPVELQRAA